jgi:thiol-disulfide isomerase/thioredoxin
MEQFVTRVIYVFLTVSFGLGTTSLLLHVVLVWPSTSTPLHQDLQFSDSAGNFARKICNFLINRRHMKYCAFLFLVFSSFFSGAGFVRAGEEHPTLPIGSAAPDFTLPATDGKEYSLSSFKDARVLVIVFTCNHCPTAQAYEDRLIRLTSDYRGRGVAVVAIMPNDPTSIRLDELGYTDMGDSFEEMKRRAAEKHYNFPLSL